MRKRLRLAVILVVALLVAGVGALVGRTLWQQYRRDLARRTLELLPGVSQQINNFRRVKMDGGRKVWEVAADEARYFDAERSVVIRGALVNWYLEDGRVVGLQGAEGRLTLDEGQVRQVELRGGIQVTVADYVVRAENAIYERRDDAPERISAPGRVEIVGTGLHLTGDGLEIDVAAQRLTLLQHVVMRMEPTKVKADAGRNVPF